MQPDRTYNSSEAGAVTAVNPVVDRSIGSIREQLGPFRLIEPLGRGGMGLVFRARQYAPVDREVAIKLLPSALDSTMRAFFEVERHSLARMQHPAIAQLYEAGTTNDGRPWFAMELVAGQTLDVYCAAQGLALHSRVRLLIRVCRAVQHAHDRGIVHRDLKPENVLVHTIDGEAMPKLIDFGIASATAVRALRAGTDAYMSPEQLENDEVVDVRHDVYAIGVMACGVLGGLRPEFVSAEVRGVGPGANAADTRSGQRTGNGERSAKALARADDLRLKLANPAGAAGDMAHAAVLRGELGYLLARSVSPRQQDRYGAAGLLAEDLQRFLDGAPISAHPQTPMYLARKFIARHRLAFVGAVTVLAGLVLALAIALVALKESQQQRDLARGAEAEAARQARIAGSVNRFLVEDLLGAANLDERPDADRLTLLEAVETAASGLESDETLEPEAEADIRFALGHTFASLGRFSAATTAFDRSAELRRRVLGESDPATLTAETESAAMLIDLSQHAQADNRLSALLARAKATASPDLELLNNLNLKLARNAIFAGDYEKSGPLLEQVLNTASKPIQIDNARRLQAWLFSRTGRHTEAVASLRTLLDATHNRFGNESWPALMAEGALATALHRAGDLDEARRLREAVITGLRQRFPTHSELGVQLSHLAAHLVLLQQAQPAEAAAREAIERLSRQFGPQHRMLGNANSHLGAALLLERRTEEAGVALLKAREIFAGSLPPDHPLILQNEERIRVWQTGDDRPATSVDQTSH